MNKNSRYKSNSNKGKFPKESKELNKRNSSRNQRRDKEIIDTAGRMAESKTNEFSWYNKYQLYTEYAGTVPFGKPLGESLDLRTTTSTMRNLTYAAPGIFTLEFVPSIGYSADRNSPINRSAIRWYSALRKMQKASSDYDSQDAMMAYMAVDSLAMFHEIGKRIIGIANNDSVLNRYVPEGLLRAMYVDPLDVRNNIEQWWGYINKFAIDANNVTMPKGITLRDRHSWMCSGIYADGTTERSQLYMFVPDGFWQYDNTVSTGSQLTWVPWANQGNLMTIAKYKQMGNALLTAVFADEDIGTISGDTLNAIGSSNCVWFDQIPRDYRLNASYDQTVLSQIENSISIGKFASTYTPVITQNPSVNNGAILYQPVHTYSDPTLNPIANKELLFNFHWEKPDVKSTIEATRLRTMGTINQEGNIAPTAFGSEVITNYNIWVSQAPSNPQAFTRNGGFGTNIVIDSTSTPAVLYNALRTITLLSAFDWSPIIYIVDYDHTNTTAPFACAGVIVDFDVTTVLKQDKLAEMHEAALTSEFDVPESFINR